VQIHAPTFFVIVGTLAAGGAAGYFASEKNVFGVRPEAGKDPTPAPSASTPPSSSAAAVASSAPPARSAEAPACDDSVGTPGACPPPSYSAEEGGCGMAPVKRCEDFKKAFKPKVAEQGVACLNALKWNERCDPIRMHLCGHMSLMNACMDPRETALFADGLPMPRAPGSTGVFCDHIVQGCATAPLKPTMDECRAILAGMSDTGRNAMVQCMKTHCSDKGLLQCEASFD
jgi:hypothetical protein